MSSFLDKIRNSVEERVKNIKLSNRVDKNNLNFLDIFTEKKQTIICEIKFSSPSRGKIYYGKLNHIEIAGQYLEQGASALSVLAEPHYFNGNVNYIKDIREKFPKAHILLKDFVLDERQIQQALQVGANAILLMASFLTHDRLSNLYKYATNLGITPLLEVHNEVELMQVLKLKPKLIGINNRNLKNLTINLNTSRSLIKNIPKIYSQFVRAELKIFLKYKK